MDGSRLEVTGEANFPRRVTATVSSTRDLSQTLTEYNLSLFGARAPGEEAGPRPAPVTPVTPVEGVLGNGTHSASLPARGEDGYVGEVEEDGSYESFASDEEEIQAEVGGQRAPQAASAANPGLQTPAAPAAAAAAGAAATEAASVGKSNGDPATPASTAKPDAVTARGSRGKTRASNPTGAPAAAGERKPAQQQRVSPPLGPLPPVPDRFKSKKPEDWGIDDGMCSGVVPWTPKRNNSHQPVSKLVNWLWGDYKHRENQPPALVHIIPVRASEGMLLDKLKPDLEKQAEEELPKDHRVHMTKGTFSLVHKDSPRWPYNGIHGESGNWVIVAGIVPEPMAMGTDGVLHGQMLVVLQWTGPQEKTPDNSAKHASQRASGAKPGSGGNSSQAGRGKGARMMPGRAGVRKLDDLADAAAVADEAGQQGRSWQPQQTQGEGSEGGEEQQMGFAEEMLPLGSMVGQQARVGQGAAPSNAGQKHGGRAGVAGSSRPHTPRVEEAYELDASQSAGEDDEQEQGQQQQQQRQHPQQAQHKPLQEEQERAAKRPRAGAQPAASAPPRSAAPSRSDAAAHTGPRRPPDTQTPLREPVARDSLRSPYVTAGATAAAGAATAARTPAAAATEAKAATPTGAATGSKLTAPTGAPSGSATPMDMASECEWSESLQVAARPENNPSMKIKTFYRRFRDLTEDLEEVKVDIGKARDLMQKARSKNPELEHCHHEDLMLKCEQRNKQLQRDMWRLQLEWLDYTT
ncbi:hypothetical protein QJQ45_008665 [Haematococcus lacustris]|nr:hypothetical protein QJQ45_008665 [Haematococcus lacustris]